MSESGASNKELVSVLESYVRLSAEQSAQTNQKIDALVKNQDTLNASMQTLIETSIKSEQRHEHNDERHERVEQNQKDQGKKLEHISNTVLLLEERTNNASKRWGNIVAVVSAVIATVTAAYFIGKK